MEPAIKKQDEIEKKMAWAQWAVGKHQERFLLSQ